jgi:hypothetical protein
MLTIVVTGGRLYSNWCKVYEVLDALLQEHGAITVIQGNCKTGADAWARDWCRRRSRTARPGSITLEEELADWRRYGPAAGPRRNQAMLDRWKPQLVVAFAGGKGTADCVGRARAAGIEVREIEG